MEFQAQLEISAKIGVPPGYVPDSAYTNIALMIIRLQLEEACKTPSMTWILQKNIGKISERAKSSDSCGNRENFLESMVFFPLTIYYQL